MSKVMLICPRTPQPTQEPPYNMISIGTYLRSKGNEVIGIDCSAQYYFYSDKRIVKEIKEAMPDIIGITGYTTFITYTYRLIKLLKNKFDMPIILGGIHATVRPKECLEHGADILGIGEGELTMLELVEKLDSIKAGRKDIMRMIKGIAFMDGDEMVMTDKREYIEDLDILPDPDYSIFNLKDFEKPSDFRSITTGRGCIGRCTFCANILHGHKFRVHSPKRIYNQMYNRHKAYGCNHFTFFDDSFTSDRNRVVELCNLIIDNKSNFSPTFNCMTRVHLVDDELLKLIKKAGCTAINYGVEGANQKIINMCKKGITLEMAEEAVKLTHKNGIKCQVNFMVGFAYQTKEDILDIIKVLERWKPYLNYVQIGSVLIPFPATEEYEKYHKQFGFTDWWFNKRYVGDDYIPQYLYIGIMRKKQLRYLNMDFFNYSQDVKDAIIEEIIYTSNCKRRSMTRKALIQYMTLYYVSRFLSFFNVKWEFNIIRILKYIWFKKLRIKRYYPKGI